MDVVSIRQDISAPDGYAAYDCEKEKSMTGELRVYFEQDLQLTDFGKHLFVDNLNPNQNEMRDTYNENACQQPHIIEVNDLNINNRYLEKCATFPHSEERRSSCIPVKGMENKSVALKESQCQLKITDSASTKTDVTTYKRSFSLPSRLKLVSAMKGGREEHGKPLKGKPNVKWAADVYDPPITLMSHTVKNQHQQPKSKKKDRNKNKHRRKSSRGNAGGKKHVNQTTSSSNTEPLFLRLQAPMDKILLDDFSRSGVEEDLDYAVSGAESKCGSSFMVESLA